MIRLDAPILRENESGEHQDGRDHLRFARVYSELRSIAQRYMHAERVDHTLQPTALVNEAFLRLKKQSVAWRDDEHLCAVAALMMRRILVNYALQRRAHKRGGDCATLPLDTARVFAERQQVDLIALDEALTRLNKMNVRQAKIVELRFFAGFSMEQIAHVLKIGKRTVEREWTAARAWLHAEITDNGSANTQ